LTDLGGLTIDGNVVTPDDGDWDQARSAWNLSADQHPAAVAFVESPADVVATVRFAATNGLHVSGQGTGHGAIALESLDDTILVKTERMRGIEIDADARTARVEAGVLVSELSEAAHGSGLSSLPGSSPNVGVIGYTLGGGLSWLGRRYGFACNRVRAIELVTAAGEAMTIDAGHDGDLFWALRGGGGSYAIVTALHLDLVPVAEAYAGVLVFPAELGQEAVRAWRDWTETVSDGITSVVRFLHPPDLPGVPEPVRGRKLLTIDAACVGSREEGEAAIAPLRALGEPIIDTFDQISAAGLCRIHMDPEQPVPGRGHHRPIRELPDEAIDAFVDLVGPDSDSPLVGAEIRHIGGALGRPDPAGGALTHLDARYLMFGVGVPITHEIGEAIEAHLARLGDAMDPWAAEGGYFNFAERPCNANAILPADVCARLAEVKRHCDPEGTIVAGHPAAMETAV
jgi:FAD/FMN-containing dehydrogenase